jgi:hypothetical protein
MYSAGSFYFCSLKEIVNLSSSVYVVTLLVMLEREYLKSNFVMPNVGLSANRKFIEKYWFSKRKCHK